MSRPKSRQSFTLIELLVVLAIVAILSVVVIMTLNPSELIKQARDSTRLSDLSTLNTALAAYSADVAGGFMGTSSVVYVSIPDTTSTCANLGLSTLPSGWSYNCVTTANIRKTNGLGWIPVNLANISFGSPLSALPIDPVNTTSTGEYYTYVSGGSFQLSSKFESQKYLPQAAKTNSNDPTVYMTGNNTSLAPFVGGLIGYWKFDEGSGTTTTDSSGYGNDGTASGTTISAGKIGNARSFSGGVSRIAINNLAVNVAPGKKTTVSFWMNWGGAGGIMPMGWGGAYDLIFAASCFGFNTGNSDTLGFNSEGLSGTYRHIVAIFYNGPTNSTDNELYLDGVKQPISFCASAPNTVAVTPAFNISGWGAGGGYYYSGDMDDVRVYNRALSAAEVLALYNATK